MIGLPQGSSSQEPDGFDIGQRSGPEAWRVWLGCWSGLRWSQITPKFPRLHIHQTNLVIMLSPILPPSFERLIALCSNSKFEIEPVLDHW